MFIKVVCPICSCFRLPPFGKFTVGTDYSFEYLIDAEKVMDDSGEMITFPKNIFKSCFNRLGEAITSYCPMEKDHTTYCVYLILRDSRPDYQEIKTYAKIMNVNYIQAKNALILKRNLLASGNAYEIKELLNKLSSFQVHYEVEPAYPYNNIGSVQE